MLDERKVPDDPERRQQATSTRAHDIQLKEMPNPAEHLDEHCHRDKGKLSESHLSEVIESLRQEKQLEPVQIAKDEHGKWELLTGHRRIAALYILAQKNVPGFSLSMAVSALEVTGASPQDHLIRSVADNEVREKLDQKERLLVTQKFAKASVPKERGAAALAISEKSYERDLRVAMQPRMLQHVLDDNLSPGDASTLIQVAEKNRRANPFYDYFDGWVDRKKKEIQELDRLTKAETDKGLKTADLLVKNQLTSQVFEGWLEALKRGADFTDEAAFNFEATLDKKTGKLRIERVNVNTQDESVLNLVKLGSKLTQLGKRVLAAAQQKHELEKLVEPQGAQAALAQNPSPFDTDVLKDFGLGDLADQLVQELQAEEKPVDEKTPEATGEDATEHKPEGG